MSVLAGTPPSGWEIAGQVGSFLAGIAGAAAAAFAAWQLKISRRDANRRSGLEGLFRIDDRVQALFATGVPVDQARADVLARYRGERSGEFTPGAQAYLNLLTMLDIVALGVSSDVIDRGLAVNYLCTLLDDDEMIPLNFLTEVQRCCDDANTYRYLKAMLLARRTERLRDSRGRA